METITEEDLLKTDPALKNRPYQIEALLSIFLYIKCLEKMFCGTGKSRIITNTVIHAKKNLSVIVFPSLALISQYYDDYLNNDGDKKHFKKHFKKHKKMNVSSESLTNIKSTTDPEEIKTCLKSKGPKIILVTYQSLDVLLSCLEGQKIGLVCYDEAHHVTSPKYQTLVFGTDYFEKEVFFTATPVNANGITMYDRDDPEKNMCGPVAYEYTYLQGLKDKVLNAFEICVDMYTENTNASIYEAMARAILTKGTGRVLSFHSGVEGESNTDVKKFVDIKKFETAFEKVQETEFPEKANYYTKITFKGMDGKMPPSERKKLLKALDSTPDNEIYIISSCETMGEGVDTKKANMCVFADPKSSITKIIQNIGRVLRRNPDCPTSTILIPCWINKEKYEACQGDREKQDEIIREQMRAGDKGDFACILNVLAALKQEDPELYDACLNYPTKAHKEDSLREQGFHIADSEDDEDSDESTVVYDEEEVQQMKEEGEIPLEIHTNETIERFNEEVEEEPLMRLYHDEEEGVYREILPNEEDEDDDEEDERRVITPPPKRKVSMNFHMSSDVQMLWSITPSDLDKNIRSAIIECEVSFSVEKWKQNLEDVKKYIDEYKKNPSQGDNNRVIKSLAQWKQSQKHKYEPDISNSIHCMKNVEIHALWTEFINDIKYADYLLDYDFIREWKKNLDKVKLYIDKHNKSPDYPSKLINWIYRQRQNYDVDITKCKKAMKTAEIHALWSIIINDLKYKKYLCIDKVEEWKQNLEKTKSYIDKYKKKPSRIDVNIEVKRLCGWIDLQKNNYDVNIEKSKHILNTCVEVHKLWTETTNDEKYKTHLCDRFYKWKQTLETLKKYIVTNKKRPSRVDNDEDIKKLAGWLDSHLNKYDIDISKSKFIMKEKEIHKLWTEMLNNSKYKKHLLNKNEKWIRILEMVKNYIDLNNKCPNQRDTDENIKSLGAWIIDQRANYNNNIGLSSGLMKEEDIHKLWSETISNPKYKEHLIIVDNITTWKQNLENVKKYIDDNKKCPSSSDKDKNIKSLSCWITNNKKYYDIDIRKSKFIMEIKEAHDLWTEIANHEEYREYLCDRNEHWKITLDKVKTFISNNKQIPKSSSKENNEKYLGKWIGTQKGNYNIDITKCKQIITNPEIHTLWTDFINDQTPKPTRKKKQAAITTPAEAKAPTTPHHFPPISEIGKLHKTYLRMGSDTLHEKFKSDPQLWLDYHAIRKRNFATYEAESIPSNRIIMELEKIKTKRQKVVVDMGCGEAPIAHHFLKKNDTRFAFHNYDHQSGGDALIQELDISELPLEDAEAEIVIMSLALWGTQDNCIQYIKEAYRVLESGGRFYISDSTKKWSPEPLTPENAGELLQTLLTENGFKIISEDIGSPFCLFVCTKD